LVAGSNPAEVTKKPLSKKLAKVFLCVYVLPEVLEGNT
jgi:hypothetical protein